MEAPSAQYLVSGDEVRVAYANVIAKEYADAINKDHKEVTLIERSGGALPDSLIVNKYEVSSSDAGVHRSGLS